MKIKLKQTLRALVVGILALSGLFGLAASTPVSAAECGGVSTSIINCEQKGGICPDGTKVGEKDKCPDGTVPITSVENTGVWGVLLLAINILTAGVGVVALGGIVFAAILYTSAGGNAEQVKKAMTIITDIVIGVLAYALMYAVLNFLIPGGLFG